MIFTNLQANQESTCLFNISRCSTGLESVIVDESKTYVMSREERQLVEFRDVDDILPEVQRGSEGTQRRPLSTIH